MNKKTGCETQRWGLNWVKYKSGVDVFLIRISTAWHRKAIGNFHCPAGRNGLEVSPHADTHAVVFHCGLPLCPRLHFTFVIHLCCVKNTTAVFSICTNCHL